MAQTYSVLHAFTANEGSGPGGGLLLSGTTLYGTAYSGGQSNYGTVFKLNTDGSGFMVLKSFNGPAGDGSAPHVGLAMSDGILYGTTYNGGASNCGTVFNLNADGSGYAVLKHFTGPPGDGAFPFGALVASAGTLYGTTEAGGSSNFGTVFKINADGTGYALLKSFTSPTPGDSGAGDGAMVHGRMVLLGNTLYGATVYGGPSGKGVIFKVNIDGTGYGIVKEGNDIDGDHFQNGLLLSGATLYGTTPWGGGGIGCIFKLNTDGSGYRVLKGFTGFDGVGASSLLVSGARLYGTSGGGGNSNCGVVFGLSAEGGDYVVLKHCTAIEGNGPGSLVLSGLTFYGTAGGVGNSSAGVVFSLTVPLPTLLASPQNQTAEAASTVTFGAVARGLLPLTYEWFFNGTNLLSMSTNHSLMLPNIQPSQAGAYTVVVTNVLGALTSAPAMLRVIPPVPRRLVPGLALQAQSSATLNLEYTAALGPSASWVPLGSVEIANASEWYFDDSMPMPPWRFYRAWESSPNSLVPSLHLNMIPAITMAGAIGQSIRVDYINQFGPTDAWVTLDTVTLTNTSQLYFDTSSIGQPPRLYQLVPVQ